MNELNEFGYFGRILHSISQLLWMQYFLQGKPEIKRRRSPFEWKMDTSKDEDVSQ